MKQGKLYFDGTTDRFNFSYKDAGSGIWWGCRDWNWKDWR